MALKEDLSAYVSRVFQTRWEVRDGNIVPDTKDIQLGNQAVQFKEATILYADLSGSTRLVDSSAWWFAAAIYKTFLYCAARVIGAEGGVIAAYDGDRVMGIFIGPNQWTSAVRCALKINWATANIVTPLMKRSVSADSLCCEARHRDRYERNTRGTRRRSREQ